MNDAFVSIVKDLNDPSRLMVRARRLEHLKAFLGSDCEVQVGGGTDYKYRAFGDRKKIAGLVAARLENINYGNFKASVRDPVLEDLYHDFWQEHAEMQD